MAELKTKVNDRSVAQFLAGIEDEQRRKDCQTIAELMTKASRAEPRMWGESIVGFGDYHYVYASGRAGDWFSMGFSPRKQNLTLYFMSGFEQYAELLAKLGKHKLGKGCLYINRLDEIHLPTLRKLINQSAKQGPKINSKTSQ